MIIVLLKIYLSEGIGLVVIKLIIYLLLIIIKLPILHKFTYFLKIRVFFFEKAVYNV